MRSHPWFCSADRFARFASVALLLTAFAFTRAADAAPETFPLSIDNGKLAGRGAEILRDALADAQFILWGEDHGFADSPLLLRALAREARPLGFKYHVVEVGPLSTGMIRETLTRDGLQGLHQLVREVPMGIPFLALKEDAELASDFLGDDGKGSPYLWGVDQEFIGSAPFHLQRLVASAPNEPARASAEKLLAEEKEAAGKGAHTDFLLMRMDESGFDALAREFTGHAEAENIIAELRESAAIYQLWLKKRNYENNTRRARLLAKNFLAAYKSAAESPAKVILKMGLEHVALGTTSVNTIDLGTLTTSIAAYNGKSALRIAFLPLGGRVTAFSPKPGNPASVQPHDNPRSREFFTAIGLDAAGLPDGWTLIPLEPIRRSLDNKGIDALKPFARFVLLGSDYIITTRNAQPATSLY